MRISPDKNIKYAKKAIEWLNKIQHSVVEQFIIDSLIDVIEEDVIMSIRNEKNT